MAEYDPIFTGGLANSPAFLERWTLAWRYRNRGILADTLTLARFGAWADDAGLNLPPEFPRLRVRKISEISSENRPPTPGQATPKWPWGNYETPHLKAFADAGKEFFGKPIAKGDEPKNDAIEKWLMDRDVPQTMAVMMARIFRDPKTPAGPRREPRKKQK